MSMSINQHFTPVKLIRFAAPSIIMMIFMSLILSENKFWVSFIDEYPNLIFTIAFIWSYSFFIRDFKASDDKV